MRFSFFTAIKVFIASFVIALLLTFIYSKLSPFYVNSFNFAVVPALEKNDTEFNYNGFYQSETSNNLVNSLSLFAASPDFKKTLENDLKTSVLYLLSNTRGNSIISIRVVTLKPLEKSVSEIVENRLQEALQNSVPQELSYSLNSLDNFNHTYLGAVSNSKFFTLTFATVLILSSMALMLQKYYYEK